MSVINIPIADGADDGHLIKSGYTSWAGVRGATVGNLYTTMTEVHIGTYFTGGYWWIARSFLRFDTSGLDDGENIESATLILKGTSARADDYGKFYIAQSTAPYPLATTAFNDFDVANGTGPYIMSNDGNSVNCNVNLNLINKTGDTKLCLMGYYDFINSAPTGGSGTVSFAAYENTTYAEPVLAITYADAPTALPILIYRTV